jgi:mono/diheme cytochrome c family protein
LSDQAIAAVANYIRNSWGNAAPAIDPDQVAKARAARCEVQIYRTPERDDF